MEGSSDFKFVWFEDRGPGQKEEIRKVEGSSDFKLDLASERGPGQKEENKKWRGPVTSSELGIRREGPHHNKEIIHARLLVSAYL